MSAHFTSDYLNAERATSNVRDTRTPDQKRWDERAYAVSEHAAVLRGLTCPDRIGWSRNPRLLEAAEERLKDALREVQALRMEGFRPGDTVGRVEAPAQITTQVEVPAAADHHNDMRGEVAA